MSVIDPPRRPCLVSVSPPDGRGELTLDGSMMAPGVPDLPDHLFKIRVQTALFELVMRLSGASTIEVNLDADEPLGIGVLSELATLWSWMNEGKLDLTVAADGRTLSRGRITLHNKAPRAPWRSLAGALDSLLHFMPAKRWPPDARFTVRDLFDGLPAVETFVGQVSGATARMGVTFTEANFAEQAARCERYVGPACLDLGDATLFAVIKAPVLGLDAHAANYTIELGPSVTVRRAMLTGEGAARWVQMQELLKEAQDDHGADGVTTLMSTLKTFQDTGGAFSFDAQFDPSVKANL